MDYGSRQHRHQHNGHWTTGLVLIGIGSLFLLDRLGYLDGSAWTHYWPAIIAVFGISRIVSARRAAHVAKGAFLIFLAFWLYASIEHLWDLSFRTSWPMILIALGLRSIFVGLASKSEKQIEENRP